MYNARDLAALVLNDPDTLWNIPDSQIKVQFDDGVLEAHTRVTIYSAYMWVFYALFPNTPAKMSHHLGDRRIGSDTHMELLGKVMWDCYDAYNGSLEVEDLCRIVYETTNRIYNHFTYRLEAHVQSVSILDFIEVIHHPVIREANLNAQPNQLSIDHTYRVIKDVLKDPRELINNPIAAAAKNGLVSLGQIYQCVGPRGFVTDIDSNIFPNPIMTGFVHGIRSMHDALVESRSASKSISFTEEPLRRTEYFNRRLQLLAASLKNIVKGDCGSQRYLSWRVGANDLSMIAGKYYRTDKGLKIIRESDRHLIGERIEMRTVLHCMHKDSTAICSTCFGDLALSVPNNTNIGHVSATALCEQASQRVLSVKHEDGSSTVDTILLSEHDQQYIRVGTDPNTIKLADRLENRRVILTIRASEAQHISDIYYVDDVRNLQVGFISDLTEVELTVIGKRESQTVRIPVAVGSRHSSLSHELLDFLKHRGQSAWTLTATGDFQIDMNGWDVELPLFVLPLKHMNMLDYMSSIEVFLKASGSGGPEKTLKDFTTPEAALMEFYALVSSRLFVNIAHLEVLIKVTMIRSSLDKDYRIPHEGNKVEFGTFSTTIAMRSLSAALAFEKHKQILNDPSTYLVENRTGHILDPLLNG